MLFSYTLLVFSKLWAQQVVGIGMMWFLLVSDKQGGRKVILDGGSLVIRKMVFFQKILHFNFFDYIKSKKMGAPGDTRGPQFRPPC